LRVLVCTGWVPFVRGGNEVLAEALCREIDRAGHEAELLRVPFSVDPKSEIIKGYAACRMMSISQARPDVDRVIALKFPAFAVEHPQKIVWLVQQYRQVYDLFGTPRSTFDTSPEDHTVRRAVHQMDSASIGEARRILAISQNVADRLRRFNGLRASVVYPPPPLAGAYYHAEYGNYVLCVGRLDSLKRVDRLIKAIGYAKSDIHCKIIGTGPELDALRHLASRGKAKGRVELVGNVDDQTLTGLYAHALAVYYGPYDEDYGMVTVEAMRSQKPVLTFDDSGGVLEFVRNGETGYVIGQDRPEEMLADLLDELYLHRDLAARLGARAMERVEGITWSAVLPHLLEG
jgi:glycosyltransferase involved in cell wall biosynthesis